MKNQLELPKPSDFHKTTIVSESPNYIRDINYIQQLLPLREAVEYRIGAINFRSVMDFFEMTLKLDVIDENKLDAFNQKRDEIRKKQQELVANTGENIAYHHQSGEDNPYVMAPTFMESTPIELPMKTVSIKGTVILYYNGIQRMIVDDREDFEKKYFDYLTAQKLDID